VSSFRFSRMIASRYLWSKRSEAFITIISIISVLGIAVGVMVLNIVMAVMTGFEQDFRDKLVGADSHIIVRKLGDKVTGWKEIKEKLEQVEGVQSVSPYTYHQALLRSNNRSTGLLIRGVTEGSSGASQLKSYLEPGQNIDELFRPPAVGVVSHETGEEEEVNLPGIVVGRELAQTAGLFIGTPVSLLSPTVGSTPFGLVPKFKRFVVTGTYRSGLVEYESGLAYISLEEAQKFFHMGDAVSGFEVRVVDVDQSSVISKRIVEALGGLASGLYAQDWTERNKDLWYAIKLEKQVYFIVLLLIVVMASISIVSSLVMIVLEKRKDIAILKTLGATKRSIATIFFLQGAIIGVLGTLLGLLFGYLGCRALQIWGFPLPEKVFQMSTLPVRIEWENFASVALAAFVISCLATLYPAWRASELEPTDALRYE
jgi:lipoprotein-releasing system permease protein